MWYFVTAITQLWTDSLAAKKKKTQKKTPPPWKLILRIKARLQLQVKGSGERRAVKVQDRRGLSTSDNMQVHKYLPSTCVNTFRRTAHPPLQATSTGMTSHTRSRRPCYFLLRRAEPRRDTVTGHQESTHVEVLCVGLGDLLLMVIIPPPPTHTRPSASPVVISPLAGSKGNHRLEWVWTEMAVLNSHRTHGKLST